MTRALVLLLAASACGNGTSWTWIDVPEALCQDGTPTGFGISPSDASDRLLIYMEGGGACWGDVNCESVGEKDGYDGAQFWFASSTALQQRRYFARTDDANPFRDFDYAYLPYCSGDLFFGDNEDPPIEGKTFVGFRNVGHFLDVIQTEFPDTSEVVLAGSSAGGFGAQLNWDRAQAAFGATPVHLLNDSGPMPSTTFDRPCAQDEARRVWNTDATMPADCDACRESGGFSAVLRHVLQKNPTGRAAFITSTQDADLRGAFGIGHSDDCRSAGELSAEDYEAAMLEIRASVADLPNFKSWFVGGEAAELHTFLNRPEEEYAAPEGVGLRDWIAAFLEGEDGFVDVGP